MRLPGEVTAVANIARAYNERVVLAMAARHEAMLREQSQSPNSILICGRASDALVAQLPNG